MLVECIGNTREHLVSNRARLAWDKNCKIEKTIFQIGVKYIVYGIIFVNGSDVPKYLLCPDDVFYFPTPAFAEHFTIVDGEIPEGWIFRTSTSNYAGPVIMPERMASEHLFMEKLYDDDPDAVQYFLELKEIMKEKYKDYI